MGVYFFYLKKNNFWKLKVKTFPNLKQNSGYDVARKHKTSVRLEIRRQLNADNIEPKFIVIEKK